ncbi:MAG: DUF3008 family protein [Caldisericia bacterium]|nr:DUF3008 family protein [Caldisericia bacterium]
MPAKSEDQRKAAGAALAAKRGKLSPGELRGAAKQMYEGMSEEQLRHYARGNWASRLKTAVKKQLGGK